MSSRQALVVGAGPAGLSAAIGLRQAGFAVTVFEARPHWQGRVCGSFLNPEAVAHLEWLGIEETVRSEGVSVRGSEISLNDKIFSVPVGQNGREALGLPRQRLEEILCDRAVSIGVDIKMGSRFSFDRVGDALVVSAAGRFAKRRKPISSGWFGWNATFEGVRRSPGEMSLHFYPNGYVGTITFADGQTNVCGLVRRSERKHLQWEDVYCRARLLSGAFNDRMRSARRSGEWRGVGPLPFSLRMNELGGMLPVGDAAAVGDPFMGEGNGRALGAGPMIYAAIKAGEGNILETYRRLWRRAYGGRFLLGNLIRSVMERPFFFSLLGGAALRSEWLVRHATPLFHTGFLVKAETHHGGLL